jgi:hypothetical protein
MAAGGIMGGAQVEVVALILVFLGMELEAETPCLREWELEEEATTMMKVGGLMVAPVIVRQIILAPVLMQLGPVMLIFRLPTAALPPAAPARSGSPS